MINLRLSRRVAVFAIALPLFATACASDPNDGAVATIPVPSPTSTAPGATTTTVATLGPPYDIVGTALSATVFNELAGLVVDAGLVEALRGGPFTVFAPTDAAFAKLPGDVLHAVQDDPDLLATVLKHHIVEGTLTPDQLVPGELTTLAGDNIVVSRVGDQTFVDGNLVGAGVTATNGEVYVMGDVLVPALGDVVAVAGTLPGFSTLVGLVDKADLVSALQADGPFTVFAPTDGAFAALPAATRNSVVNDPALLAKVLTYHVVAGKLNVDQLLDGPLTTLEGSTLTISHRDGVTLIDGVPIVVQNVQATNGVIHVIGAVLVPTD